jgi:hypothetical protein
MVSIEDELKNAVHNCDVCNKQFVKHTTTQRFCSVQCQKRFWAKMERARHPSKVREYLRAYRRRKGVKERLQKQDRERYRKNPKPRLARNKKYIQENLRRIVKRNREYYHKVNPNALYRKSKYD